MFNNGISCSSMGLLARTLEFYNSLINNYKTGHLLKSRRWIFKSRDFKSFDCDFPIDCIFNIF